MTIYKRILFYSGLLLIILIVPFGIFILYVKATGVDDEQGLIALIPGYLIAQFLFGLLFIKKKIHWKLLLSLMLALFISGLTAFLFVLKIIHTDFDAFRLWDLYVSGALAAVVMWELYFQINRNLME